MTPKGRSREANTRMLTAGLAVVVLMLPAACSSTARDRGPTSTAKSISPLLTRAATSSANVATPTASGDDAPTASYPTVGGLFKQGAAGPHFCTASVIASATGNTVITAAHCVPGSTNGRLFIPGYRRGAAPYGSWRVTGTYVAPSWQRDEDPHSDFAVLTVAPRSVGGRLEQLSDVTGSERLGTSPAVGTRVTLVAYNSGRNDVPVACTAPVYDVAGYPTIDCHGFTGGSSGSPWMTTDTSGRLVVAGVIGGRLQGGCRESTSHTSPFTDEVDALVTRAEDDSIPDADVSAVPDGCS